jgi:hypothetical protein
VKGNWPQAQSWEQSWWGNCCNTLGEETKQLLYAKCMGLETFHDGKSPYNFDLGGISVLDIGGGPVSLLLKCVDVKGKVIDPLVLPDWVIARYKLARIEHERTTGELLAENGWSECWIYNVLQHVANPELVIRNAQKAAALIRLFEWIDTPTNVGHPHSLSEKQLNEWLGGEGKVETFTGQYTCSGKAYYGIFVGER